MKRSSSQRIHRLPIDSPRALARQPSYHLCDVVHCAQPLRGRGPRDDLRPRLLNRRIGGCPCGRCLRLGRADGDGVDS